MQHYTTHVYYNSKLRIKMTEDPQDKLYRILTRSPRIDVYKDIVAYRSTISKRTKVNPKVMRSILNRHGWTLSEYIADPINDK